MSPEERLIDLSFGPTFGIDAIHEIPASFFPDRSLYFAGHSKTNGIPALLLRITPRQRRRWAGTFVYGYGSPPATNYICGTAVEDELLVVAGGQSYVLNVEHPEDWRKLSIFPIRHAVTAVVEGLIILCSDIDILAYGAGTVIWRRRMGYLITSAHIERVGLRIGGESAYSTIDETYSDLLDLRTGGNV